MACSTCGRKGGKTRKLAQKFEVTLGGKKRTVNSEQEAKYLVATRRNQSASYRPVPVK